ncbi:MAG: orotidine-5'-phosphate decarboxylase [Euryarchaeota archaeon]|nr:orotidine-5'-phosphate decarboxylase [Euryarchaeota archaeon]
MPSFNERLESYCRKKGTRVCVGLDLDRDRLPQGVSHTKDGMASFLAEVIEATEPFAAAYKPNVAFYEAMGIDGMRLLETLVAHVHAKTEAPVILDAKRGDVGHTAKHYAEALFGRFAADAVTVSPYMGWDAVAPFTEDPAKGVFVLTRTSNPSAGDLQDLEVGRRPLYLHVADLVKEWNGKGNVGVVAGATGPEEMAKVRKTVGAGVPFLVPGVGAQGGDPGAAARAAADAEGGAFIVNAGRSILFASEGRDYAKAAASAAEALRDRMRTAIGKL